MKTDEPRGTDEERSRSPGRPGEDARAAEPAQKNGGGRAPQGAAGHEKDGDGGPAEAQPATAAFADLPTTKRSYLLRFVYWLVWFVLLPVVLACLTVWLLTPSSAAEPGGVLGWAQSLVRAQPVPVGIVLFTFFEVALWSARHQLPFANHADPPLRADLPQHLRGPFERARAIIDEAEMILTKHERAVVRDLTAKEREKLRGELVALRTAMDSVPFDEDEFIDAVARADGEIDAGLGRWRKSEVREYVEAILMAVAVAFALRTFVVEAFKIPSGSMIPTLMVGDHIFVNKFSYGPAIPYTHARIWTSMPPRRGDVIVFAFPEHPDQDFIKRVIVVEGDKLEARGGHPIINGWEVPSCRVGAWTYSDYDSPARHEGDLYVEYLGDESYLTFYDRASGMFPEYQGPYFAKGGEVWVMGDNRNNSHDSRMWFAGRGGGVPFENIRGRALFVWLSFSDNGMDWSREGAPVMGRPRLPPAARGLEPQLERCLKNPPAITMPPPSRP
ncbi:MAG TPA: signal peptidase I [Polyangiaceae bacterium]|nr:signal peptidase I [Polyangiaceae bacterium]